jgi:hypothetical protein
LQGALPSGGDRLCRVSRVRHAQWLRCSHCHPLKPFKKPAGAKNCSLRRYQLGLVEEREVNRRIIADRAFVEATRPCS